MIEEREITVIKSDNTPVVVRAHCLGEWALHDMIDSVTGGWTVLTHVPSSLWFREIDGTLTSSRQEAILQAMHSVGSCPVDGLTLRRWKANARARRKATDTDEYKQYMAWQRRALQQRELGR